MGYINLGSEKLPSTIATARIAIIAQVDGGKTYTAGVLEEELEGNKIPFVVIDGMGAHWGLREKYKIPILGHMNHSSVKEDIQLEPTDGLVTAYLIVERNMSCILDISAWSKDEQRIFVADLLNNMYRINKTVRHLVIEEADTFMPQKMESKAAKKSLLACDNIIRRGRQLGFGTTIISQRPQLLNKDELNMTQIMIIGHMDGARDIYAIKEYMRYMGMHKDELDRQMETIVHLKRNEKVLVSPQYLGMIEELGVRKRYTYHAGRTPRLGEVEEIPTLQSVEIGPIVSDLNEFQEQLNKARGLVTKHDETIGRQFMDIWELKHPTPKKIAIGIGIAVTLLMLSVIL